MLSIFILVSEYYRSPVCKSLPKGLDVRLVRMRVAKDASTVTTATSVLTVTNCFSAVSRPDKAACSHTDLFRTRLYFLDWERHSLRI